MIIVHVRTYMHAQAQLAMHCVHNMGVMKPQAINNYVDNGGGGRGCTSHLNEFNIEERFWDLLSNYFSAFGASWVKRLRYFC